MISLAEKLARTKRAVEIEEAAHRCLTTSSYPVLRQIACHFEEGVLTMRGRVCSFYLKQVAQTAVGKLKGVQRIENCIEVAPGKESSHGQ